MPHQAVSIENFYLSQVNIYIHYVIIRNVYYAYICGQLGIYSFFTICSFKRATAPV